MTVSRNRHWLGSGASYDAARSWRQGRRSPSTEHLERLAELAEKHGEELRDLASDL